MQGSQIKAVVLDLGGVVLGLDWAAVIRGLQFKDPKLGEELTSLIGKWDAYDLFERGKIEPHQFFKELKRKFQPGVELQEMESIWNRHIVGPIPGVEQLLKEVSLTLPVYALSNTTQTHYDYFHSAYSVFENFKKIYTSFHFGLRKPEKEIFHALIQELSLVPHEILFIDDNAENVEAARQFGLKSEQVLYSAEGIRKALKIHSGIDFKGLQD